MHRNILKATSLNNSVALTAVMGIFCANVIIAEGGGPLQSYELRSMRDAIVQVVTGQAPALAIEPAYYPVRHNNMHLVAAQAAPADDPFILLGEPEFVIHAPSFEDLDVLPPDLAHVVAVSDVVEAPIQAAPEAPLDGENTEA